MNTNFKSAWKYRHYLIEKYGKYSYNQVLTGWYMCKFRRCGFENSGDGHLMALSEEDALIILSKTEYILNELTTHKDKYVTNAWWKQFYGYGNGIDNELIEGLANK